MTLSLKVTVQSRGSVVFVGFVSATAIEETDGAVVSQLPVVHVTFTVSVRVTVPPSAFLPVAVNVTVPEPDPGVDELTVTVESTLSLSVLLVAALQVDGIVIVSGESIAALRAAFPVAAAVTLTVEPFAKTFGEPAAPFRLIAISALLVDATLQPTLPKAMVGLSVRGVTPSPSATALSASAIAGMASSSPNIIKRSVNLLLNIVRISTCLPSEFPYTSASLCPFLSSSSLLVGFHGFGRLLTCSKYRLSGREGHAICHVTIYLRLSYMPCGIFCGGFVSRGTSKYAERHMHNACSDPSVVVQRG